MAKRRSTPPETRFWPKVKKTKTCWLWTAATHPDGYGIFRMGKEQRAHRVSWILNVGPIPDGLWVLHECDTPACVRPEHLFLGTQTDNMADCAKKGRFDYRKGSANNKSALTEDDIPVIRTRLKAGESGTTIGHDYGVSKGTISKIKTGRTWTHVPQSHPPGDPQPTTVPVS